MTSPIDFAVSLCSPYYTATVEYARKKGIKRGWFDWFCRFSFQKVTFSDRFSSSLTWFIFNWRINVLPCCVGFCRISTWISHRCIYMSLPSWTSFPPPTLSHPSRLLASPSSRLRLPCGSVVKNLPADAGDMCLIPGSERSPGGGNGDPLQYLYLGNPMDRRAWGLWSIG